jgi:hypothetical protein
MLLGTAGTRRAIALSKDCRTSYQTAKNQWIDFHLELLLFEHRTAYPSGALIMPFHAIRPAGSFAQRLACLMHSSEIEVVIGGYLILCLSVVLI